MGHPFLARGHYFIWRQTCVSSLRGPLTTVLQYNHCEFTINRPNHSLLTTLDACRHALPHIPAHHPHDPIAPTPSHPLFLKHASWSTHHPHTRQPCFICRLRSKSPSHTKTPCRDSCHLACSPSLSSTSHRPIVTKCRSIFRHVRVRALQ
jgi:hypothetical protein